MKNYYLTLLFTGLQLALLSSFSQAQVPVITALNPARNQNNAPVNTNVSVTFDQPISNSTASKGGLLLIGQLRGGLLRNGQGGTASVSGSTLTFNPTTNFRPGETVFVTSTTAIQSTGGSRLARGQVYQFTTQVAGTGRANFTPSATNLDPAVGESPWGVALGDVDGDGDLDLLCANAYSNNVSVRLNVGMGNFIAPPTNPDPAVGDYPYHIALGDVDADGDLDLVTANYFSDNVSVRLNDGTGNFTAPTTNPNPAVGDGPLSVALGDVDGDGDLDMLCANRLSNTVSVRLNDPAPPSIINFAATPSAVCASSPVTFTATVGNVTGAYNYTLSNGSSPRSGTANTTPFSQTLTASGSGSQSYTLTVSNGGTPATAVTSLTVNQSGPTRLYVKANATGANTGLSWDDAFTDLQSALKYPCVGNLSEIWIARGVYKPRSDADEDAFSMLPDVAIYGGFEGTETDLSQRPPITLSNPSSTTLSPDVDGDGTSANNSSTIIYNTRRLTSTAILDGVVITPPASGSGSAAIVNKSNGDPTSTDNFGSECSPQFRNLLFIDAANYTGVAVTNIASNGGITSPSFINCVFRDSKFELVNNQGTGSSGFTQSVIAPQFVNCVIANNVNGTDSGSGIPFLSVSQDNSVDQSAFINCSFLNVPGGVVGSGTDNSNDIRLTNCVLWNTGGPNTFRKFDANSLLNVTVQYSLLDQTITGYTSGPGNLTATSSPFVSASDLNLPSTSPAVNAGNPASVTVASGTYSATNLPATDAAANPRLAGGRVDMGALEVQTTTPLCGTVVFVTQTGAGLQNGSRWTNAFSGTALQTAINTAATCGAQVWVAQGLYKPTTGTNRSISFVMKPGVAIYGGFRGTEGQLGDRPTIIPIADQPSSSTLSGDLSGDDGPDFANNAENSYHVIKNDNNGLDNTAVLDGFVISGGNANGNNSTDERGGAIYSLSSSPRLINCSLQRNSALVSGGAIYDTGSSFSLINCSFQQNAAVRGGAIYINASNPILINCWFQANTVTSNGGAIYNNISNPSLVNCSLQNNTATVGGGAIYNQGNRNVNNTISLINSVLFNNGGANTFVLTDGGSLSASYSLFEPSVTGYTDGGNNLTTTITPFASGSSVALNACSPAINSGSNSAYNAVSGPLTDLAGNTRVFGGTIDRGAYEYQSNPTSLSVLNPTLTTATVNQPFNQSFTASGGSGTYSFSVVSSNLPTSLSLSGNGVLSGTPTQAGSYSVLVQVSDANGCGGTASTAYNLVVTDATPTITGFAVVPNRVCVGSPITFTATIGNIAGDYGWSLENGGPPIGSPSPTTATAFSVVITALGSGVQTFTLTVNSGGQRVTATTSLTVNALPIATLINNGPLTCAQTSVTLTASGGTSYSFTNGSGQAVPGSGNTRTVSSPGTYSVAVGDVNGCASTTTTTVGSNTVLSLATGASLPQANVGVVVSLTASGAITYQWNAPSTAPLTTPSTGSAVSASLTTAGVQTFTVVGTSGVCSQSALVSVTALAGPDLSAIINLPDGNFSARDNKGLLVRVQEVNGAPASGTIIITITVPVGYSVSFDNTLTSFSVSGGSTTPVQNTQWHQSSTVAGQQVSITINTGQSVVANSTMDLGFSITRTSANSGSVSNITVNVADDSSGQYDVNRLNNVYARIINGI